MFEKLIKNKDFGRTKRGQAAMEYLMTYGWAILVIVIVITILAFYLPQLIKTPEGCLFSQPGFSCSDPKPSIYISTVATNDVSMAVRVFNQQGQNIKVSKAVCLKGNIDQASLANADTVSNNPTIVAGGSYDINVACKDATGNPLRLSKNSDFKGIFVIWYNFDPEVQVTGGNVVRQASATVTGTVLERTQGN
ncbi:MAG: hypothetical protein AABX38_02660 [Candidatus Micrarchaeota archaeon]